MFTDLNATPRTNAPATGQTPGSECNRPIGIELAGPQAPVLILRNVVNVVVGPVEQLPRLVEVKVPQVVVGRDVTQGAIRIPRLAGLTVYLAPTAHEGHPGRLRRVRVIGPGVGQFVNRIADGAAPRHQQSNLSI